MVESKNGYTPPADYKAPDFVRQWADTASRGADRIEQEREQRARDAERAAAQRAQDGQRALDQTSQDAQRSAGQSARDAQRAAEQLARDEGRAATSTAARATYDLDRVGEGAKRGLAYTHGGSQDALRRGSGPAAPSVSAPFEAADAPQPTTAGQAPPPPLPPAPSGRAARQGGRPTGNQPGLKPGLAVGAGVAAIVAALVGLWFGIVLALIFAAPSIRRGFRSGAKGVAVSILAILLFVVAAGIQLLQFASDSRESSAAESSATSTPVGLEGDAVVTDPVPELTLEPGVPLSGYGEANIDVLLPSGAGELAVLEVVDTMGDVTFLVANPQATEDVEFSSGIPGDTTQWLVNTAGADAAARGEDPTPVATNSIQVISGGVWEMTLSAVDVLPTFDATLSGEGAGLYLYTGAGGEAAISAGDYGKLQITTHGATPELTQVELPETVSRTWQPGPMVVEVEEARRIDGTPQPWSIQVAQL
ncbi:MULTISPECIES: hypothetical protein [unclassified Pseudoclavibacter]|uniref:hypothetical protein n=1 Tax=unclassified Pseudoclavibacter TaxID=2615177 RepID=UPI000CE9160A|nr:MULTISPECIES: hypothetical protein [unclassified Pseudoclavibacter]PPG22747.1 hypothetical protein C5E13_10925 [Pseudoclavibacter sp. RFBI4]